MHTRRFRDLAAGEGEEETELAEFRMTVRRLAADHFTNSYVARAQQDVYPHDTHRRLGEAGLLGLMVPTSHGGQGAGYTALGIACEELGYSDIAVAMQLFNSTLQSKLLVNTAAPAVVQSWLPGILTGETVGCVALTEPGAGSDAAAIRTRAVPCDNGWLISGEKTSVTAGPHADVAIVLAKTDSHARHRGVTAFLVPLDDASVGRTRFRDPGLRPIGRGSITFDETYVPENHVIGEIGQGFRIIMETFDLSRTMIGLMCVGAAQRGLDLASAYVTQREAFGQAISAFQGVSFPIAEHTAHIHTVRLLCYHVLRGLTAGRRVTSEAAMVKWLGPERAGAALRACVVLHGHNGWSLEFPLQSLVADVSGFEIGDGTPQIQKLIIARDVIGHAAVAS